MISTTRFAPTATAFFLLFALAACDSSSSSEPDGVVVNYEIDISSLEPANRDFSGSESTFTYQHTAENDYFYEGDAENGILLTYVRHETMNRWVLTSIEDDVSNVSPGTPPNVEAGFTEQISATQTLRVREAYSSASGYDFVDDSNSNLIISFSLTQSNSDLDPDPEQAGNILGKTVFATADEVEMINSSTNRSLESYSDVSEMIDSR